MPDTVPAGGPLPVVGFIGLGNMGQPMSRQLLDADYQVRGFDPPGEES